MKLTADKNREELKQYRHIRPAPGGTVLCSARCPGTTDNCTLRRGHAGPHVAHGRFRKVAAVWDKSGKSEAVTRRVVGGAPARPSREGGLPAALKALRNLIVRRSHSFEEYLFLILGLAMAGFAVHWLLLIFGWG